MKADSRGLSGARRSLGSLSPSRVGRAEDPHTELAGRVLENIRKRLLDLTGRNPLLNYRPRKRDIQVDEPPNPTFESLLNGGRLILNPIEESSPLIPGRGSAQLPTPRGSPAVRQVNGLDQSHIDGRLRTEFDPKELERRCRNLRTAARTAIDETGANFLYLAIGFVEWYEAEHSNEKRRAPLLLVPVEMMKGKFETETDTYRYSISYLEEDIESNLPLVEKLKEFNYDLPLFDDESDPERYFEQVSNSISAASRWSVTREMILGLFSFSKILMYRDLEATRWPEGQKPTQHEGLTRVLIGVEDEGEVQGPGGLSFGDVYSVDEDDRCERIPLVVDADSSQHSALVDAVVEEKSLALHGPPGTGKSQTITNVRVRRTA